MLGRPGRGRGLAVLLAALLLAACRPTLPTLSAHITPLRGGTVTEAIVGAPGTLNPLLAQDGSARDISSLIYQGLTTVGKDQQPEPLLASGWAVSKDRLTYTFTLRHGIRWGDGQPFSAADVLFTFKVLQDLSFGAGANPWQAITVSQVAWDKVSFSLKAPTVSFPFLLTIGILPAHVFGSSQPDRVARDPHSTAMAFGTGPFMVRSISSDHRSVDLERNPYARPSPYLAAFDFRAYPTLTGAVNAVLDGAADSVGGILPPQLSMLRGRSDLAVFERRTFNLMGLFFNLSPPNSNLSPPSSAPFDSPQVRQAINRAIDRRAIVKEVLQGRADPAYGPIPPPSWAYSASSASKGLTYDPAAAASALKALGWTLPRKGGVLERDGKEFRVSLVTADAYPYLQVAERIRDQLALVGVEVVLDPVPSSILVGHYLIPHDYQTALAQLAAGPDADQSAFWHSDEPGSGLSFAPLPGQGLINRDLEQAEATGSLAARRSLYDDFQSLVAQAGPAVFLYEPHYLYVISKRVHGVRLNPVLEPTKRLQYAAHWYVITAGG